MIERAEQLIRLADEWKERATRIRRIVNKKKQWHFTDQRDWGKAAAYDKAAKALEVIAYAMKHEAEGQPPDPGEPELLKWEREAREKIMRHDINVQELTLNARIFKLTRMIRNATD